MEELLEEFFTDTSAHIESVEESLLALEKEPERADLIDDVFRRVHSVKGNAGVLGISSIHAEGAKLEGLLEIIRERKRVEPGETDQLFMELDALKEAVHVWRAGGVKAPATPPQAPAKPAEAKTPAPQAKAETPKPAASPAASPPIPSPAAIPAPASAAAVREEEVRAHVSTGGATTFLTFMLGREKYGMAIMDVREIILREVVTPVPNTKPFVEGVMNLRDQIIPIFSLRRRLGIEEEPGAETERNIVIVEISKITTGLKVDEVLGIVNIHARDITPPERFRGALPTDFLLGIGDTPGGSVILLNSVDICDPDGLLY